MSPQAYRRLDDDRGKSHELGQSVVACMRGILHSWLRQSRWAASSPLISSTSPCVCYRKLELWKSGQSASVALHTIVGLHTGQEILSTAQYHHLQVNTQYMGPST